MQTIGILVTSYEGHRPYLAKCLEWLARVDYPAVIGWDGEDPKFEGLPPNVSMVFFTGERLGLQRGERVQIVEGMERLMGALGCVYVLKVSGDQAIGRPENIASALAVLGDSEMMVYGSANTRRLNTKSFFGRVESVLRLFEEHGRWQKDRTGRPKLQAELYSVAQAMGFRWLPAVEFWTETLGFVHYHSHKSKLDKSGGVNW